MRQLKQDRMPWYYYLGAVLLKVLLGLFTRWQVTGRENLPAAGPVLIVSNHLSNADPPILGVSLTRPTFYLAKIELFRNRFVAGLLRSVGSVPVDRRQFDKNTLQQTEAVLASQRLLTIFPEGRRSKDGCLQRGFHGAALVALRSGAPVLPVAIIGTEELRQSRPWRRVPVTVTIGKVFTFARTDNLPTREELDRYTIDIMSQIAALLPPERRGEYGHRAGALRPVGYPSAGSGQALR